MQDLGAHPLASKQCLGEQETDEPSLWSIGMRDIICPEF